MKPWLSSADIDKGARWGSDVAGRLQAAKAGIICLTPSNLHSDWILFEAGALSKTLENTYVSPLLIGIEPADVKGPLAQFQATRAEKNDILKLVRTLNRALCEQALTDTHIEEIFVALWPSLETDLKALPSDDASSSPQRNERDLLEEILALVRNQNRPSFVAPPEVDMDEENERRKRILDMIGSEGKRLGIETKTIGILRAGDKYILKVTGSGSPFGFELPVNEPTSFTIGRIKSQMEQELLTRRHKANVREAGMSGSIPDPTTLE